MDHNQPGATQAQPSTAQPGTGQADTAQGLPQPGTAGPQPGTAQAQPQPSTAAPQPGTAQAAPAAPPRQHVVRRTRTGGVWVALALSAVVLLLLLIFILENGHRADIVFFGAHVSAPLGVALLLSAVAGALVVIIPGTGRIIQLRITARRHRRADAAAGPTAPPGRPGPDA
jgi:lipopolysaccharide assembly protein A